MGNTQQSKPSNSMKGISSTSSSTTSARNEVPPVQKSRLPLENIITCFDVEQGPLFISKEARNYKASSLNQHSMLDLKTNQKLLEILRKRIKSSSSSGEQLQQDQQDSNDNNNNNLDKKQEDDSIIINNTEENSGATKVIDQDNDHDQLLLSEELLLLSEYKKTVTEKVKRFYLDESVMNVEEERAFACLLGLMIGDACGAPLEFSWYKVPPKVSSEDEWLVDKIWKNDKEFFELTSMNDEHVWKIPHHNKFFLKVGQFTDDSSMALCVMDTLVQKVINEIHQRECLGTEPNNENSFNFDGREMRLRFLNWVYFGYNNTFGKDDTTPGYGSSCGLGSNVRSSIVEFMKEPSNELTKAGDLNTSGNGSIMRLAPIPIFCLKLVESLDNTEQVESALKMAHKHSKTTHQGDEAAELCRLMTFIIIQATKAAHSMQPLEIKKHIFNLLESGQFQSTVESVNCLVNSQVENGNIEARNWNWKDLNYEYCPARAEKDKGYIGSYAMDAMAMALHNLAYTDSFEDAILLTSNMAGDSDTVSAIVGQMAGAIYGLKAVPLDWIEKVLFWDYNEDILLRLSIIYNHSF